MALPRPLQGRSSNRGDGKFVSSSRERRLASSGLRRTTSSFSPDGRRAAESLTEGDVVREFAQSKNIRRVVAISYDAPHLKSQQVLQNWSSRSAFDVVVAGLPFKPRNPRAQRFAHRPPQDSGAPTRSVCEHYGYKFIQVDDPGELTPLLQASDVGVVLGSGILPAEVVSNWTIVNCHPGVIPESRGQDAFKWAVLEDRRLGVSLHVIDEDVDMGHLLHVETTPIFSCDTLEVLARRHYDIEIFLLSTFDMPRRQVDAGGSGVLPAMRRMSEADEARMLDVADAYIARHGLPVR